MSLKEISELLKDLIESNKQLTLRLKMLEIEIKYIKENIPGKISFLKNRLGQLCMSHNIQRKAKRINTQIYCKDTNASTQWGCEDKPYKKRKNLKKGLIKKKNFSKQKYIPRKKYYKKKKEFSKTKPDSKCKCYNCGEEGHRKQN